MQKEKLLDLIRGKLDHPATPREMLQRLKIRREQRATFKRLLGQLVSDGSLVQTRGNRFGVPDRMNLVVGRITTNPRGFGFVVPDRPLEEVSGDIYYEGRVTDYLERLFGELGWPCRRQFDLPGRETKVAPHLGI